jgi:hypothetical protein
MGINTAGLPAYTEQDTKTLVTKPTATDIRLIDKVKKDKAVKAIKSIANKIRK